MSIAAGNTAAPSPFPIRRFTVEEYHRLGELGILTTDDAVELLSGCIVPKMIHNPLHDAAVELADNALRPFLPEEWRIRIQSAITTEDSEPEPDLIVVRGSIREHVRRHPQPHEIGLLVEIADSSVQRDRLKAELYAYAGIEIYWIVNVADSQLELYTKPIAAERRYESHVVLAANESVEFVLDGGILGSIPLASLLP